MMWRRLRFQRELERVPLLSELSLYERSLLAKQCTRVTFEAGSKIMQQGDVAEKFFILLRGGAVALRRDAEDDAAEALRARARVAKLRSRRAFRRVGAADGWTQARDDHRQGTNRRARHG